MRKTQALLFPDYDWSETDVAVVILHNVSTLQYMHLSR